MGKVSRWTCTVILLCLCRIGLCQHFPGENPSSGFKNAKLNIRNLYGSKLVQRLADSHQNGPHYEQYPYEQVAQPLPPPPFSPSSSRGMIPYEYQNQRIQVQTLPSPPPVPVRAPPPHLIRPPQSINQENVYTETITSSCPCPECAAAAAAAEANQNYPYRDDRDSYVEEECPCERGCPCERNCPCGCDEGYVKGNPCPCGSRCPYASDSGYQSERDYSEREPNYDDYHTQSDCPCCCSENQDCPCAYSDEPEEPPHPPPSSRREPPSYRAYTPVNQMNGRYSDSQHEVQMQRRSEGFVNVIGQSHYQPPPPPREILQQRYKQYPPQQYEEVPEQAQYMKMQNRMMTPIQRGFPPHLDCPESIRQHPVPEVHQEEVPQMSEIHEKVIQRTHVTEVAERPIHQMPEVRALPPHMMAQPHQPGSSSNMPENIYSEPVVSTCPCSACETCSECEAADRMSEMQQGQVPEIPQRQMYQEHPPRIPVQNYSEPPQRGRGWRRRMPPPRRMIEEEEMQEEEEPPVPIYRSYKPVLNRRQRKFRQPGRPPFFDGLSYSDGC